MLEPTAKYIRAAGEKVLQHGNLSIVLGRDRPGARNSGYGGRGHTGAGTIDMVAGRQCSPVESTLNYVYKGDRHASIFNYDFLKVKSQDYLNLYLSYVPDNSQWKLNFWGKNLEDKRSVVGIRTGSSLQGGVNFLTYDQGRQIGAEFEYKF